MKKLLLAIAAVILVVPFITVKAANELTTSFTCDPSTSTPIPVGSTVTCRVYGTPTSGSFTSFSFALTPSSSSSKVTSITLNANEFTGSATGTSAVAGNASTAKTGLTLLFTFSYQVVSTVTPCSIKITPTTGGPDTDITYKPEGETTTENPSTGSYTPYLLISGGAIAAVAIYVLASKKTKFYRV